MKKIKLRQDNGNCNKNYGLNNGCYSLELSEDDFNKYVKIFFNWHTPTKKYVNLLDRYNHVNSKQHDDFIASVLSSKI